jgi:type VI secretion system protein ImpK
MRQELARLVLPVIDQGLDLYDRLRSGGPEPNFPTEQAALVARLLTDTEARRVPDYGGDTQPGTRVEPGPTARSAGRFLGVRYALVCWLDELFILHSSWERRWNENKLEVQLYGSNDRAWQFWEQARQAGVRPSADALEAFYLCVMLGFTGERVDRPAELVTWIATTRTQVLAQLPARWDSPAAREPVPAVPPRRGFERFQRMLAVLTVAALIFVPVAAFAVVRYLAQ